MNVITVSQVNTYIKALIDESAPLKNIYVVGEISNFLHYFRSGHMYFTLKDEKSQLKAVMFCSYSERLKFTPEDGMRVICRGRISAYEKDGVYQLYVEDMQPDGLGALNLAYEQLKEKLSKEGLFDEENKRSLPRFPKKIGVATSDMGAAIEDIKNITARRYPLCELVIVPTQVQGVQAAPDIVKSIQLLDSREDIDLIIVGRGGGSIEDLWAFNTEEVARAVYACSKPVISAVGHETDFTICDFVADLRAPTPSAAAELAVPDINDIAVFLNNAKGTFSLSLQRRLDYETQRLDSITDALDKCENNIFESCSNRFDLSQDKLKSAYKNKVDILSLSLSVHAQKLNALSPLATLSRGYCIAENDEKIISSKNDVSENDDIKLIFSDGEVNCRVI
ncbi:MAG: exodeoxyribonuclease VII large subunit [Eubacteriales bacterium]|nr:exodeoxyribonuclease VII large subunit [Eubacteriales bacterium]